MKRDQFKFLYKTMEIIYNCALRDFMISENPKILNQVIPNLTAYRVLLLMKDIDNVKEAERLKELEKQERDGKKV